MMRTFIVTMAVLLAGAVPGAAQEAADAAKAVKAAAKAQAEVVKEATKVAREVQREVARAQRVERAQREREDQRARQTETISRTVKLGAQGEIDLQNMSGDVTVTRGSGSEVAITATKTARAATEAEAKEMLGHVRVDIAERAGRVEVRTHYMHFGPGDAPEPPPPPAAGSRRAPRPPRPPGRRLNVSVAYTIAAPAGTSLKINTMSGDIAVSDITGELQLEAMSGDIKVERGARVLAARAMSGDVTLVDVKSDGALDAGSMSGDVVLRQVHARRINASVVSGTVTLTDVECERLEGQATSGEVIYEGALSKGGRYRFSSHSGDVKVLVAGNIGFALDANSWGGSVRSELELKNVEQSPDSTQRTRVGPGPRSRMLRGTFGDGSAVLDITTFSGSIVVGKRSR